ncbi:GNAT family N-acetyltransferase [Burkholderia vietnamiensis]|jgi:RimJ/RimL family protein N-acetyltransferase|uniref:GNAT family N-acetyltransferase n=1 Tax=Burkholderia TaxID=32008 RepID=UPI000552CE98|nr:MULTISPECIES: GNAT family protein [Burkholderia]KVF37332.1 GCN5 family acetyltransferase [Burkholderia vietnamiensis]KVF81514.1 GCN5 family acetyltransferase [Burkholderia vietnamiensis]KVF87968.1 GCN5 family acetyltransferase [Burkholderia vietnamiensis]KVF88163.1 GCN5 family acetyltransferase [Burkholderia vietnamiensis]KVG01208.1 GCN5 family acetyltransferase [Burkholderia vietnamiensis]
MTDTSSLPAQPTLTGEHIVLRPLAASDRQALLDAAADGELWNLKVTVVPDERTVDAYLDTALQGRAAGTVMPFAIVERASGRVIGSTRFWKIDRNNRKLEIGHTWLSASAQRTRANTEAKWLLLAYAFDTLQCVRVQFTTDELNEKSRAAILRLGAKQEGIVRHERIMPDGRKRNSVRFSIIDGEWPAIRDRLKAKLAT